MATLPQYRPDEQPTGGEERFLARVGLVVSGKYSWQIRTLVLPD
ncbi:MAG: hypothetical protein ACI80F_000607 [Natronomonas sp.]|jgi:hypothetical protein